MHTYNSHTFQVKIAQINGGKLILNALYIQIYIYIHMHTYIQYTHIRSRSLKSTAIS